MENITIDNFEYKNNMSVNNDFTVADVMNADDEEFEKLLDEFVKQQFDEPDDDEKEEDSDDSCDEKDDENDDENDYDEEDADENALSLLRCRFLFRITIAGDNSLHKGLREGAQLIKESICPH